MQKEKTPPLGDGVSPSENSLLARVNSKYNKSFRRHKPTQEVYIVRALSGRGGISKPRIFSRYFDAYTYASNFRRRCIVFDADHTASLQVYRLEEIGLSDYRKSELESIQVFSSRREAELFRFGYSEIPEGEQ